MSKLRQMDGVIVVEPEGCDDTVVVFDERTFERLSAEVGDLFSEEDCA